MIRSAPIPFEKGASLRIPLVTANADWPSIQVGANQELVIWGAVTYIIHKAM